MAQVATVKSNSSGLRIAEEISIGVLDPTPTNQLWVEQEPNSFTDFGGNVITVERRPINQGRQKKKGVVVNIEAGAGFDADLTQTNMQSILQGFMYATIRSKQLFTGSAQTVLTADDSYGQTAIETGFFAGDLLWATGFTVTANNGLKSVASTSSNKVLVDQNLVDETSGTTAKIEAVGFEFAVDDATITQPGPTVAFPTLTTTTKDLTQLGIIPGEWIFVGGDTATTAFALNAPFFARVRSVTATVMTFDKTDISLVADDGTSDGAGGSSTQSIRLFKGRVIKNEIGTSIIRRTYTIERTLGYSNDSNITLEQAEYVSGAVPNEWTMTSESADKVTVALGFVPTTSSSIDENVSGADSLLSKISGVIRQDVVEADAFNTSSDFSRISVRTVSATSANPDALFTYSESLDLNINNNNSPNNALGVLGAFEVTEGVFEVSGNVSAYFGNVASVQAVRNNEDVSIDLIMAKSNTGLAIDLPLVTLGGGRLSVEQDQPVKIPLEAGAASGAKIHPTLNHTLMFVFFDYLPTAAQ